MLKVGEYVGKDNDIKIMVELIRKTTVCCVYFYPDIGNVTYTHLGKIEVERDIKTYNLKYVDYNWD